MSLIRKENNLRKAQARLDKVSKRSKQFQIRFQREQNKKGKFRTKIHIERGEKEHHGRGILHKAVGLKYRVKGDKPSVTRFINSTEPKTFKGKIAKKTAQAVNLAVHDVMQTAVDTGLAAETTAIKIGDVAQREVRNKLKQKYTREAVDDYHNGVFLMGRTAVDAVKGTRNHFKQKKQFQLEKAKFKLKKADNKLYRAKIKPKLADNKAELRKAKKKYGLKRRSPTTKFRRLKNMRLRQELRQSKRELKFERNQIKTEKKFRKKELSVQKIITKDSKPTLLLLKPAKYTAGRMKASAWQKAVNEDQDNDFVHVIDSAKRRIIEPAVQKISQPERLQREQKKRDSVHDKKLKSDERLKKQDNKLKDKHDSYKQRKRKPKQQNKQAKKTVKETISQAFKYVKNIYEQEVKKFFGTIAVPILIILLVFAFIIMIFTSVISGGSFTLGTYAAKDYDLSEAEKYYTKLAYDMNEKILKVSDSKKWKTGLTSFGANKKDLKDKPDKWYWGKSDVYDWDPEYDFDCYKLWAFLCAYYYDFDAADNGDIKYWKFKSDTKTLLEELFNAEYEFVYWYDNKSRWEELDPYNYWGGGSASEGTYYRAEQDAYIYDDKPYRYRFKPIAYTSEIGQFRDSDGYICITDNYRVLDPNKDYALTGFYVRDHRYYAGESKPFYMYDGDVYFFNAGGSSHDRSFWGWDSEDAWFLVSPTDTTIWNSDITDTCMYAYYEKYHWKTECNLYYNVKQKKTFDKAIEDKLKTQSHKTERLAYYNLLVGNEDGNTMYGNHQTLRNMLPKDSIRDYNLKREFGYEMTEWNQESDGLYQGIKVYADSGTVLTAPFSCKITDINTSENKITLRKDDVQYWYDGTGGTKRDTEVEIANAALLSGLSKGDTLKEGQKFAKTTADNVNFHINIDTDGIGWDYVDPRLVLY